jgi:ferredoxin
MGSGHCAYYASHTFDLDETSVAIVIDPDGDPEEDIQRAIRFCPTRAISSIDMDVASDSES